MRGAEACCYGAEVAIYFRDLLHPYELSVFGQALVVVLG